MRNRFLILPPFIAFLAVSIALVAIWFKDKIYIGGGDVGLPFYNPGIVFDTVKYLWWDNISPGYLFVNTLSSVPLYAIMSLTGLSGIGLEMLFFCFILFSTLSFSYLFSKEHLFSKNNLLSLLFAIFYTFNPFSLFHIWHRFVHTGIIMYMLLPVLGYFYLNLLKKSKFRYFILFLLTSFLFSYVFGTPAFAAVLWLFITFLFFFHLFMDKDVSIKNTIIWSIFIMLGWITTNIWWILPLFTTEQNLLLGTTTINSNLKNYLALGGLTTVKDVIRGINSFHIQNPDLWMGVYNTWYFKLISWVFAVFSIIGFWIATKRRSTIIISIFWLLFVFLAKGSATPFALVDILLFKSSFFFGIIRNPYEKLGLVTFFLSDVLVILTLSQILKKFINKFNILRPILIICAIIFTIYLWPFWFGHVFGDDITKSYVNPPEYYQELGKWLEKVPDDRNILRLPLSTAGGVTYKWDPVYSGIDPFPGYFSNSSLFSYTSVDYVDKTLDEFERVLRDEPVTKWLFYIKAFDIKYIVVHNDIDWKERGLLNPEFLTEKIEKSGIFPKIQNVGRLEIFEVPDGLYESKIVLVEKPMYVEDGFGLLFDNDKYPDVNYISVTDANVINQLGGYVIHPKQVIFFPNYRYTYPENSVKELPATRFMTNNPLYYMIRLKEALISLRETPDEGVFNNFIFSGKRLSELIKILDSNPDLNIEYELDAYVKSISKVMNQYELLSDTIRFDSVEDRVMRSNFARHYFALEQISNSYDNQKIDTLLKWYKDKLKEIAVLPYTDFGNDFEITDKKIFRYNIPETGNFYVKVMVDENYPNIFSDNLTLQLNKQKELLPLSLENTFINYGNIDINRGLFEVAYTPTKSENLVPENNDLWGKNEFVEDIDTEFIFTTDEKNEAYISSVINGTNPDEEYELSFKYWIEKGSGVSVRIEHDSDVASTDYEKTGYERLFDVNEYNLFWNDASWIFTTKKNMKSANIKFIIKPWNNCLEELKDTKKCLTMGNLFKRSSRVHISDIKVRQLQNFSPVLVSQKTSPGYVKSISNFKKKSPVDYQMDVEVKNPSYIIFKETFHPGWKVYLNAKELSESNHYIANGFANSWFIENPGTYNVTIIFKPQLFLVMLVFLSLIASGTVFTGVYLYSKKSKL